MVACAGATRDAGVARPWPRNRHCPAAGPGGFLVGRCPPARLRAGGAPDDPLAQYGVDDGDLGQLVRRHGEGVAVEDDHVGQVARLDGAQAVFGKPGMGGVGGSMRGDCRCVAVAIASARYAPGPEGSGRMAEAAAASQRNAPQPPPEARGPVRTEFPAQTPGDTLDGGRGHVGHVQNAALERVVLFAPVAQPAGFAADVQGPRPGERMKNTHLVAIGLEPPVELDQGGGGHLRAVGRADQADRPGGDAPAPQAVEGGDEVGDPRLLPWAL